MSSRRAEAASGRTRTPPSIVARLAALYAASTFLLLVVTTAFLYWTLVRSMERDDYFFVVDKAQRLEWLLRHQPDSGLLRQEVDWSGGSLELEKTHLFHSRILDGEGRTLLESPAMAMIAPVGRLPPPAPAQGAELDSVQHWRSADGRTYRVVSARAHDDRSAKDWVIQVAMEDSEEEETIDRVRRASVILLILGTLASACVGALVARRGMKPLREVAGVAERITASQLNERIDPARWPSELGSLAQSVNRMLQRLEDAFVRISQFAADLAHELRTPIHNMMGEAEVALSADRSPEEYRRILESSLEEFERLSRMINEMLFLARAENPREQISRARLDARRELEAVREFFDALCEARGVTVACDGQGEFDADPLLFRRAVTNLLSNALRHTPPGGRIVLSVEHTDHTVIVKVTDSGCGIREEHLPRICDRLYCADRSDAQLSEQTGLGLSIVKSIVELHGGSIAVESAPGKGTTVQLRFPAAASAAV